MGILKAKSTPDMMEQGHVSKSPADASAMLKESTAVIGGITGLATIGEVDIWLRERLWGEWGPEPIEVYCKGDYKHVAFAKFKNHSDREAAIKALHGAVTADRKSA